MPGVISMTNDILQKTINDKMEAINKLFAMKESNAELQLELDETRSELVDSEFEYYDLRCAVDRLAKELTRIKDELGKENFDGLMAMISVVPDRKLSVDAMKKDESVP